MRYKRLNCPMKTVIVGGGISGLATAFALLQKFPNMELGVFESASRAGGKVWSDRTAEGFLCESGVNAFLDSKPRTLELVAALNLRALTSSDEARRRFVYSEGELHQLPATPPAFLTSKLLSLPGKLRVMAETLVPRGRGGDETLSAFALRRLGREAYEKLIDPMASGVFAGDPDKMSLSSCFPRIHEIEMEYRSLILGLIKLQIKARGEDGTSKPSAGPAGKLTSFNLGMSEMTQAIAEVLGSRLRLSTSVSAVARDGNRFTLELANGERVDAARVILAAPAYAQAQMLEDLMPLTSNWLASLSYPSLSVICLGYRKSRLKHPLNGFGFLVPSRERRKVLGVLWDSSIFANRAPEGHALIRCMIGGARATELANLPDDQLIDFARSELSATMGVDIEPDFLRIYRHEKSIPQYRVGHTTQLLKVETELMQHPGLILTGNAYKGVALNDCVANAYRIAESFTTE